MTRSIRLSIAPATATTCGDGSGKFCPMLRTSRMGTIWHCHIYRQNPTGKWPDELWTDDGTETGRLLRWPECISAEDLAPR